MKRQFRIKTDEYMLSLGKAHFRVDGVLNGKRTRRYFPTRELAEQEAIRLNLDAIKNGHQAAAVPNQLRFEALTCQGLLARVPGVTLTTAVQYYLAHHDLRSKSILVKDAWNLYQPHCEKRVASGALAPKSWETLKKNTRDFATEFAAQQLIDCTTTQVRDWLEALNRKKQLAPNGKPIPLANRSRGSYRLALSSFFSYCVRKGWISEHPMRGKISGKEFKDRNADTKLPDIFTVQQANRVLAAATPETIVPIAIGLFAGLRPAEIWRLDWSDILWEKKLIDVKAKKTKTGQPRWIPISENLLQWLAPYRKSFGPIFELGEQALRRRITAVGKAAGFAKWPQDVLRHSFGSYHLALHEDSPLTSLRMGHMTPQMVFGKYNNRRTKEEAEAFFQIRPTLATLAAA